MPENWCFVSIDKKIICNLSDGLRCFSDLILSLPFILELICKRCEFRFEAMLYFEYPTR